MPLSDVVDVLQMVSHIETRNGRQQFQVVREQNDPQAGRQRDEDDGLAFRESRFFKSALRIPVGATGIGPHTESRRKARRRAAMSAAASRVIQRTALHPPRDSPSE